MGIRFVTGNIMYFRWMDERGREGVNQNYMEFSSYYCTILIGKWNRQWLINWDRLRCFGQKRLWPEIFITKLKSTKAVSVGKQLTSINSKEPVSISKHYYSEIRKILWNSTSWKWKVENRYRWRKIKWFFLGIFFACVLMNNKVLLWEHIACVTGLNFSKKYWHWNAF